MVAFDEYINHKILYHLPVPGYTRLEE
jgi:hypothetical protein